MYVAARSNERPVLIHSVTTRCAGVTLCGLDLTGWSREYMKDPIGILFCKRCRKFEIMGWGGKSKKQSKQSNVISIRSSKSA